MNRNNLMKIKILLSILLGLTMCFQAEGKWLKGHGKLFNDENEYKVIIEEDQLKYDGLSQEEFIEYYAAKNDMTPNQLGVFLKFIGKDLIKSLSTKSKKIFSTDSESIYVIKIRLEEITGKAGMKANIEISICSPQTIYSYSFPVEVEDGRWNRFDVLLQENIEKMADKILNGIRGSRYKKVD